MNAREYAQQQIEIWSHLPYAEKLEQVEAHMESEGFRDAEIATALDEMEDAEFRRVFG